MPPSSSVKYILSAQEYALLRKYVDRGSSSKLSNPEEPSSEKQLSIKDDFNAATFRSASRIFLATTVVLTITRTTLARAHRLMKGPNAPPREPIVSSRIKFAVSLSSILFVHRLLYRLFTRLRLQLLHEKVRTIQQRYPRIYAALTSHLAPAIGASISGFGLGFCPADQLRVTIAIYCACRALELAYTAAERFGYIKNKPWWFGSWLLFPLAQGQLLHAFVFDRDCFPEAYGSFILSYTPEYIQRRPATMSRTVRWPNSNEVVDALAEMARLRWPQFMSPILHPKSPNTLPKSINKVISPITSRANPAHQNLSCALLHPSEISCFMAYLRQNLIAFPQLARFFTLYYGALSLLRVKQFYKTPITSLNRLSQQILRTTISISGAIGASWGSICLFAAIFPRAFLPQFRFVLGGLMGGSFQYFDQTPAGHGNALYAARTSVDSLWKVGVKRRWWRSVQGGDVWLFVAALALVNVVYDIGKDTEIGKERVFGLIRVLRGDVEVGMQRKKAKTVEE